jgi:hypothetical protein
MKELVRSIVEKQIGQFSSSFASGDGSCFDNLSFVSVCESARTPIFE